LLGKGSRGRLDRVSGGRLRRVQSADRVTLGLAALTALTAGTVAAGEFTRRLARRGAELAAEAPPDDGTSVAERIATEPLEVLQLAGRATQDTVVVALEGYSAAPRQETVLFNLLSGFAGAFAFARISTAGIRDGWWPSGNVRIGGRHIHHFVPGILIAFATGTAALVTEDREFETALAIPFGVGVGLTFDEAALLLDLRDVYWTREGVLSVQLSLGGLVLLSGTILALRMLRRGEELGVEQGLIPDAGGGLAPGGPVAAAGEPPAQSPTA
jgi:hypothetical protein